MVRRSAPPRPVVPSPPFPDLHPEELEEEDADPLANEEEQPPQKEQEPVQDMEQEHEMEQEQEHGMEQEPEQETEQDDKSEEQENDQYTAMEDLERDEDLQADEEEPASPTHTPDPSETGGDDDEMPVDNDNDEVEAPSCPEAAPDWFRSIFDVMNHPELGEDYCALLRAWCDVEEEHGFDANKGVAMSVSGGPAKPAALTMWIQRGRRAKKLIIINDFELFEAEMWDWWNGLQPDWREWDEEGFPRTDTEIGEDWGALAVHGQNGLASAVACLCWWGASLHEGASRESWERCVADVRWVAEHVVA